MVNTAKTMDQRMRFAKKKSFKKRKHTTIRFTSRVKVISVPPLSSKKDWYHKDDFMSFYQEGLSTIKALKLVEEHGTNVSSSSRLDPNEYCLRGLEKRICKTHERQRKKYIMYSVEMIVLMHATMKMEREMEQQPGNYYLHYYDSSTSGVGQRRSSDAEKLRALSMTLSKISRDRAFDIAAIYAK